MNGLPSTTVHAIFCNGVFHHRITWSTGDQRQINVIDIEEPGVNRESLTNRVSPATPSLKGKLGEIELESTKITTRILYTPLRTVTHRYEKWASVKAACHGMTGRSLKSANKKKAPEVCTPGAFLQKDSNEP